MELSNHGFQKLFNLSLQNAEAFSSFSKTLLDHEEANPGKSFNLPLTNRPFNPHASSGVVTLGYDPETGESVKGYGPGAALSGDSSIHYGSGSGDKDVDLPSLLAQHARLAIHGTTPSDPAAQKLLASGTAAGGGVLYPELTSGQLIDLARSATQVVRAGAFVVPISGDTHIAQVKTDPVAGWKAEGAPITKSEPTFGRVSLRPKTLAVYGTVSGELLEDGVNVGEAIAQVIGGVLAVEMDRVCLRGIGAAHEPLGVLNTAGIGSTGSVSALTNYHPLSVGLTGVLSNNLVPTATIFHPQMAGKLDQLVDTVGQPLQPSPMVAALPKFLSTSVPDGVSAATGEAYVGDFRQLWIGIRRGITVEFSRHASNDTESAFRDYTVFYRAIARMDVAVVRPSGFHCLTGIDNS